MLQKSGRNPLVGKKDLGREADVSKVRVQICPSHAEPGLAMPEAGALLTLGGPEPGSPVMLALAATRVRLATVVDRYSWNRVQLHRSSQPR